MADQHHLLSQSSSEKCLPLLISVDTCVEGDVRLVGGSDAKEGWVEICRNNTWGTVCNDGWSNENTLVVCTQLGLQGMCGKRKIF